MANGKKRLIQSLELRHGIRLLNMFVLLTAAVLLPGCGKNVETYIGEDTQNVVLRTVSMAGGSASGAGVYEEIRQEFMAENPNIYIEDETRTSDEQWKNEVVTDFSVGERAGCAAVFYRRNGESDCGYGQIRHG